MYYRIAKFFLAFFDNFYKKKIFKFLKRLFGEEFSFLIDVGAHHGESVKIFSNYFKVKKIIAFEPSKENFGILEKKTKNYKNLKLYNIALGEHSGFANFTEHFDSESSTLTKIDKNSNYYKKKNYLLNFFGTNKKNLKLVKVKIDRLDQILINEKFENIDMLKIDTEGYDFFVLKGLGNIIQKVKVLYFEHHFHNMLKKNYTLSDVHSFLIKNNFKKVYKNKMFFRKTFEYIYTNNTYLNE